MIDNCVNCGIPARIIYSNYYSTTTQLVSEKTLLDETKTSNFCLLIVYVGVVYINRKAVKCRLNYIQIHGAGYRLQRKLQI